MSVKTFKPETGLPYFCTITNKSWIPLFEICEFHDKIYKWFDLLKSQGNDVLSYVIMPNHLHLVLHIDSESQSVNKIMGEAKRLWSYSLSHRLKHLGRHELLQRLSMLRSTKDVKNGNHFKFFEDSFDGKAIFSDKFLKQKIDYIHNNPVRKKLVGERAFYEHSSERYYATGIHSAYPVTHYVLKYFGNEEFSFNRKLWWG